MNRPDFSVADLGELDTLITTDIAQGANVWVDSDGAYHSGSLLPDHW